jgi:hypothetical protein
MIRRSITPIKAVLVKAMLLHKAGQSRQQNTPPNHQSVNKNQQILKCYLLDFISIRICRKTPSRLRRHEMSLLGKRMMTL